MRRAVFLTTTALVWLGPSLPALANMMGSSIIGVGSPPPGLTVSSGPSFVPIAAGNLQSGFNCYTTREQVWTGAAGISDIKLYYVNAYLALAGGGEVTTGLGNTTWGAWIEYPGLTGGQQQVTWNSGNTSSLTTSPGLNLVFSDDIPLTTTIPANTSYHINTSACSSLSPGKIPAFQWGSNTSMIGDSAHVQYNGSIGSAGDQSNTIGGLTGGLTTGPWVAPVLILSKVTGTSSVGIIGDSAEIGKNDLATADAINDRGIGPRALNNSVPWVSISQGGGTAAMWSTTGFEGQIIPFIHNCFIFRGADDIGNGATASATITALTTISNQCSTNGARVFMRPIPPRTSSSDNWTTLTNQTSFAGFRSGQAGDTVNTAISNGTIPNFQDTDLMLDSGTFAGISGASFIESGGLTGYPNRWLYGADGTNIKAITCDGLHPCGTNGYIFAGNNVANRVSGLLLP